MSDFGRHFIISSLLYNAECWVWNIKAIIRILTCNPTLHNATLHANLYTLRQNTPTAPPQRGKTPLNENPGYDTKQSNG